MQLTVPLLVAFGVLLPPALARVAHAEDRVDFTTTWFQERRAGGLGGLTIIHPQLDVGVDLGEHTTLGAGYSADVVTGATAAVYSVDAVTSATKFDDLRQEGKLSLGFRGSRSALTITGGAATERDYLSISVGASANIDLPGKNTNIALSYTHNFDQVCDRDNAEATPLERRPLTGFDECKKRKLLRGSDRRGMTVWHDITIDTAQAAITQNLSPVSILQLSVFGQVLSGFQSNPYRRVRTRFGFEAQETVPDSRARLSLTARYKRYLRATRAAIDLSARAYTDTWKVNSGTLELAYNQYIGTRLLFRVRTRAYQQTPAKFFKDAFFYETEGTAGAFMTGDRELGRLRHFIAGGKLTFLSVAEDEDIWGWFEEVRLNVKGDLLFLQELHADREQDNRDGIDRQFLSSGQFFDGFVLQLAMQMAY